MFGLLEQCCGKHCWHGASLVYSSAGPGGAILISVPAAVTETCRAFSLTMPPPAHMQSPVAYHGLGLVQQRLPLAGVAHVKGQRSSACPAVRVWLWHLHAHPEVLVVPHVLYALVWALLHCILAPCAGLDVQRLKHLQVFTDAGVSTGCACVCLKWHRYARGHAKPASRPCLAERSAECNGHRYRYRCRSKHSKHSKQHRLIVLASVAAKQAAMASTPWVRRASKAVSMACSTRCRGNT